MNPTRRWFGDFAGYQRVHPYVIDRCVKEAVNGGAAVVELRTG
jgi:(2Fe-2S) ferredoxin